MKAAASATTLAASIAAQFDALDKWEDFGSPIAHREAAEDFARSGNESSARLRFEFRVFPIGARWQVKRRER
jgi:hypothetical protein